MIFTVFIENKFNFFIDQQIISLEKQVNTIYPDILNKQIDTKEIKKILESTFENSQTENIDAIVTNIFKATIKNYTSLAVETINKLEKKENKLSIKEALVSLKEISYGKIIQYIKVIRILLTALLVVYCIISLIYSIYNSKQRVGKNKSIIFGEESEDTALGMNVEN
ncbi:MAG: hypothetical protein GX220_08060 [Treponema sp.]|nr:hypothetical protein [Treponema sp.]